VSLGLCRSGYFSLGQFMSGYRRLVLAMTSYKFFATSGQVRSAYVLLGLFMSV
jgi:hypothetical protein